VRVELEAELGCVGMLNMSLMPHVRDRLEAFRELVGDSTEDLLMLSNLAALGWFFGDTRERSRSQDERWPTVGCWRRPDRTRSRSSRRSG
jgi:hypothetical protein